MRYCISTFVLIALCSPLLAQGAPKTVFEGRKEILYADGWASPKRWGPSECTVTASKERLADGRPTVHMYIPVDHFAGEKKYPIGWPRMGLTPIAGWEKDWTNFDTIEFSIYTESTRTKLPKSPLSFGLYCPDRSRSLSRPLNELKLNQWVKFSYSITKLKIVDTVKRVAFNISESSYKHEDQLHFYIGGFRFVRSAECELNEMKAAAGAVFQGQPSIDVEVEVVGVPKGISRAVPFTLRLGDKVIRAESLPVHRGRYVMAMDISELKLAQGTYTLVVFEGEADKTKTATFRVVNNPWKEQ